jgi:hypothetical protein
VCKYVSVLVSVGVFGRSVWGLGVCGCGGEGWMGEYSMAIGSMIVCVADVACNARPPKGVANVAYARHGRRARARERERESR